MGACQNKTQKKPSTTNTQSNTQQQHKQQQPHKPNVTNMQQQSYVNNNTQQQIQQLNNEQPQLKADNDDYKSVLNDIAFQNLQHFIEYSISSDHVRILKPRQFGLDINLLNKKMDEFIYNKQEMVQEIMKVFELIESEMHQLNQQQMFTIQYSTQIQSEENTYLVDKVELYQDDIQQNQLKRFCLDLLQIYLYCVAIGQQMETEMINRLKQYEFEKQKNDLLLKSQIHKAIENSKKSVDKLTNSYNDKLKNKCVQKMDEMGQDSCDFQESMEEIKIGKNECQVFNENQQQSIHLIPA